MSGAIDKNLELKVSFEKAGEGAQVSDACMTEIVSRLRVALDDSNVVSPEIKIAPDSDNILTKNSVGELRVQKDTYFSETQDVAVPGAVVAGGDTYLVPVTRRRITSIILESGDIVLVPNGGQTSDGEDPPTYSYPETLSEFADNLNTEGLAYTWEVVDGTLRVTSDAGLEIASVIEGGEAEEDAQRKVDAVQLDESVPGDATITFEEAATSANIDYPSMFMLFLDISPGDGFEKAYITKKESGKVTVKIEKVSKALEATLKCFTPAQKEDSSQF